MPANPKYLSSPSQRVAKITAGIIGGYVVMVAFHLLMATWFDKVNTVITLTYTGFILWVVLMIVAFIAQNGWKVWLYYLTISIVLSAFIYFS